MDNFIYEALTIEAAQSEEPRAVQLTWRGTSRAREPSKILAPYLASAVGWAAERKVPLEMRFDKLQFFNSATVMAIIKSHHLARAKSVPLRIFYAADVEWQKLSFDPMRIFQKGDGLFELVALQGRGVTAKEGVS